MNTTAERLNSRWELVILGIVANACLGTVYSWSVLRGPLEVVTGMSPSQSGVPYSVFLAAFAFSMPLGGFLIERIGSRLTLLLGGVLVGLGWIGASLLASYPALIISYGMIGGVGVGLGYGVPLSVAESWFPKKRGLAMGLTLAGFGVSPFVTAPLAERLIARSGVLSAMLTLGIGFIVVVGGLSVLFVRYQGQAVRQSTGEELTTGEMVRTARFYVLWVTYGLGTMVGLTAIGLTASYAQESLRFTPAAAAAAVSLFGVANGVGRPLFGTLHDRLSTRLVIAIAFAVIAAGALLAFAATPASPVFFYAGFGTLWLMLGGWLAIAPAATVRLFGSVHYTSNYGLMYTAYGVGALAGGAVSGVLYNQFNSYRPFFLVIVAICLLGAALGMLGLRERVRDADPVGALPER